MARVTPYHIWRLTAGANLAAWLLMDRSTIPLSALLLVHVGIFLLGVFDLRVQFFVRAPRCADPREGRIALTFDDGPDPDVTGEILDILGRHGLKATFFVVGERAKQHPDLVRRTAREGHVIACHDLTHGHTLNFRTTERMVMEIAEACEIVRGIIGRVPRLYRPPNGLSNPGLPKALGRLSMDCIAWSRAAREGGNARRSAISRISTLAAPGHVILLHDILRVPALKDLVLLQIDSLCASVTAQSLRAVGVDELLGLAAYGPEEAPPRSSQARP